MDEKKIPARKALPISTLEVEQSVPNDERRGEGLHVLWLLPAEGAECDG